MVCVTRGVLVAALGVLARSPAAADDANFRPYLVGARAAGMGGAFTALADDGSGPYYNPAGIAYARRSSLSLSASIYGYVSGTIENALGEGNGFDYGYLNTFPVSTSIVRKFGARDTPDGSQDSAVALSVFVPDAFRIDDRDSIAGEQQNAFFLSNEVQTVWGGVSYARRFGVLGIGASAFVLIGSEVNFLDLTAAGVPDASGASTEFITLTARSDTSTLGAVGALGVRYDPSDSLSLGLSIYSPALGTGSRRSYTRATVSIGDTAQIAETVADDLHATPSLPVRVQAGLAWRRGSFTLAADAIVLGPRTVRDDPERAAEGLDRTIVRNTVVNGSLGAELVIADAFPIRIGGFTDLAATDEPVPAPSGMPDPNPTNTGHVDRFGGTLSIGYRTPNTSTDAGIMVSAGSGREVSPNNLDFSDLIVTTWSQRYAYFFIASTYEF